MSKGAGIGSAPTFGAGLDDELPPPYTASAGPSEESVFTPQLRNIHSQLQHGQAQSDIHHILASLIDPVESFLASVSQIRPAPKLVEAAFVPADALSSDWTLTDQGERESGEVRKVVRVPRDAREKGKGIARKGQTSGKGSETGELLNSRDEHRGFDDWGRYDDETSSNPDPEAALWWVDEDLARRLAQQLSPSSSQSSPGSSMTARAEQVTFRRENEMGIWESKTGWGVVGRVILRR